MIMDPDSKLMIVVMVLVIILLGLAFFLFYLERRLSRSEKQIEQLHKDSRLDNDSFSKIP